MSLVSLNTHLLPLKPFLDGKEVMEISINRPEEIWVEQQGVGIVCHAIPELSFAHLRRLADLIAESSQQEVSEQKPLLSAALPEGHRVQIVLPPAVEVGQIVFSIRKQVILEMKIQDYSRRGAFGKTNQRKELDQKDEDELRTLFKTHSYGGFLEKAVQLRKNILISAGTFAGKTTFLNACLKTIPADERIITIEDTREVKFSHPNRVHLLASRGEQGMAQVTPQQLLEASLRLRPDRIILGELRGKEAFAYLRAINSGHPGSLTTIHADSPELAFEQLALMVMQADLGMQRSQILEYAQSIIPIVVQLKREEQGSRFISEIYYREAA